MAKKSQTTVDTQGLTPNPDAKTNANTPDAKTAELKRRSQVKPGSYGKDTQTTDNSQQSPEDYIAQVNDKAVNDPAQALGNIQRSPKPDARDDAKVDRLAAPDWRGDQPMPSAANAQRAVPAPAHMPSSTPRPAQTQARSTTPGNQDRALDSANMPPVPTATDAKDGNSDTNESALGGERSHDERK